METLHVTIHDSQTKDFLMKLLRSMEGVDVKQVKQAATPDLSNSLRQLSGIWAKRDISLDRIRECAWKRKSE
jgi:hypothetical protein